MRRLPLLLLVAVLAAVLGAAAAAPAWAHTRLVSSTPAAGTPAEAPDEVELVFSDPVQPGLSAVSVTGTDGREQAAGAPSPGDDDSSVSQPLAAALAPGTYTVAYRVVAADGHPVTGAFDITAVAAATAAGPTATAPPAVATSSPSQEPALRAAAGTSADDGGTPVLPLAVGGLVVAGAAGLLARRLGGSSPST